MLAPSSCGGKSVPSASQANKLLPRIEMSCTFTMEWGTLPDKRLFSRDKEQFEVISWDIFARLTIFSVKILSKSFMWSCSLNLANPASRSALMGGAKFKIQLTDGPLEY